MSIKLIALDLDGTLLLPDKTISEENKIMLNRASAEKGVHIVLATGRTYSSITKILEWVPCIRYVVMSNGAVIQDTQTGDIIAEHFIRAKDALEFYDYAAARGLLVDFFYNGKRYVSQEWEEGIEDSELPEGAKKMLLSDGICVENQRTFLKEISAVEKISIRFHSEKEKNQMYEEVQKLFPQFKICSSLNTNIEANYNAVTKAAGVQELAEYLGIDMSAVMAFGDSGNDYEMISAAGIGVAMGNAEQEIKAVADRITKDNTENGVAYMIEEVFGWQQV